MEAVVIEGGGGERWKFVCLSFSKRSRDLGALGLGGTLKTRAECFSKANKSSLHQARLSFLLIAHFLRFLSTMHS